jgi:hypothetical protein
LGAAVEAEGLAEGLGEELDEVGVGEVVDAVGLAGVGQYSPGLHGEVVVAGVGQYSPGLHGGVAAAESAAAGVSDAVPGATRPFIMVPGPPVGLLAGDAASPPPHAERTSAPARSATTATTLPERHVAAGTARIAYLQSPAFQPDEKTVSRKVSDGVQILRHRSRKV